MKYVIFYISIVIFLSCKTQKQETKTNANKFATISANILDEAVLAGGNGLGAIGSDATAAKVTDSLGGMAHMLQVKSDGTEVYMVADNHAIDIDTVATIIAQVLDTGAFTVASGVATLSDTDTVTVTKRTDLEGI